MTHTPPTTTSPPAARPMTPKEFSDIIGRTPRWVRKMCARGKIPSFPKKNRPYLIPRRALGEFGITA